MSRELGWQRVAVAIQGRMRELGLRQQELSDVAGVSTATLRKLLNGGPGRYRPETLRRVGRALGWPPDTLIGVFEGRPVPADFADPPEPWVRQLTNKIALLDPIQQRAVSRLVDDLLKSNQQRGSDPSRI